MRIMSRMLLSALIVSAAMWVATYAVAQQAKQGAAPKLKYEFAAVRIPAAATEKAMRTFSALVNEGNFRIFGFERLEAARDLRAGVPIEEFMVRLDRLARYSAAQEPSQLLQKTDRATVPVLVGQRTQSSLTMRRKGREWEASGFGGSNYARLLEETRNQLAREHGRSSSEYFEVRVPALNVSFIGNVSNGRLSLTPLWSDTRYGFDAGKTLDADQALLKLVPAAKEHNRLPT